MNASVLKKCIDELAKDKPDLSYIRGMLETLSEMSNMQAAIPSVPNFNNRVNVPYVPEERAQGAAAIGPIGRIS